VPSDYDAVGELASNVYIGGRFSGPEAEARLRDVSNWCREGRVLVAESPAGELIGCVALFPWPSSCATVAASGEVEVRLLAASPAWRGAGAGAALMEACEREARETSASALVLWTKPQMAAAQRLYARLGYVRSPGNDPGPARFTYRLPVAN
jgi:GNAT superfamily N-acetyltransferase